MSDQTYAPPRVSNAFDRARGQAAGAGERLTGGFLNLLNRIEPHLAKAPADVQPAARKAVEVARARPLLTMAGLAVGALVLARGASRR